MYSLLVDSSLRCLSIPHGSLTRGHPTEYKGQLSLHKRSAERVAIDAPFASAAGEYRGNEASTRISKRGATGRA